MRRTLTLAIAAALVLSAFQFVPVSMSTSGTPGLATALALSVVPPKLPADGRAYPAVVVSLQDAQNRPSAALENITVFLTSSESNIVSIPASVTIHPGEEYVVANVTTTSTPGSATITASAEGLSSPQPAQIATAVPSGYPSQVLVSAVPSNVPALPSYPYGKVIVELEDQAGLPARAITDTTVKLISLNQAILNVSGSVVIGAGQVSASASFATGPVPGQATIIASASGYQSGSPAQVTVVGPAALKLKLYPLPSALAACIAPATYCHGTLVVALTDLSGVPVHAPGPIAIHLRSNDTARIDPPSEVVMPRGNVTTRITYDTTGFAGAAQITASAAGLASDLVTITTYVPARLTGEIDLKLEVGPSALPADNCQCGYASVSITNKTGVPVVDSTLETITLTSSQAFVGNFSNKLASIILDLNQGSSYLSTVLRSTFVVGTTQLTASAENRVSSFGQLSTTGSILSKLSMTPLFGQGAAGLPADGNQHPAFEISLFDSSGNPVPAPANTVIQVNSTAGSVLQVQPNVDIPTGRSAVLLNVSASVIAGRSNLTAYLRLPSGILLIASDSVTTTVPAPSKLQAYVAPASSGYSESGNSPILVVQLQDSQGNPARARQDTSVVITSSNQTLFGSYMSLSIPQGSDYAFAFLHPTGTGGSTLTVSSPGLASMQVQVAVVPGPLQVRLLLNSAPLGFIYQNQTATFEFTATFVGQPVRNVNVTWTTTGGGELTPAKGNTGSSGTTGSVFTPTSFGAYNVTASADSPLTGAVLLVYHLTVAQVVAKPGPSLVQQILGYWYYLVAAAAVVVIAVVYLFRMRRKRQRAEIEAGFEVV